MKLETKRVVTQSLAFFYPEWSLLNQVKINNRNSVVKPQNQKLRIFKLTDMRKSQNITPTKITSYTVFPPVRCQGEKQHTALP